MASCLPACALAVRHRILGADRRSHGLQEMFRKFEKYGDVDKARIVRNNVNGESRGFGFVQMMDEDGATAVLPLPALDIGTGKVDQDCLKSGACANKLILGLPLASVKYTDNGKECQLHKGIGIVDSQSICS